MFFFNSNSNSNNDSPSIADNIKKVEYGKVPFITFICVVLSKLAYLPDCGFLPRYEEIFGSTKLIKMSKYCNNEQPFVHLDGDIEYNPIPSSILTAIKEARIEDIFNDKKIFKKCKDITFYTDTASNEKFVDFIKYAEFFNILNGSTNKKKTHRQEGGSIKTNEYVQYISLAWSNYSTIYIVADKRSNSIFIVYRGTASFKGITSYINFNTFNKNGPCETNDAYIPGIFKITTEAIHTLLESVSYLAIHFLKATKTNSIKVFATGHSLGGAMATIFSYLYNGIRNNTNAINNLSVLSKQIVCISVGAPRCINDSTLKRFNYLINQNLIMYRRLVTKGDPIPLLPHKAYFGYYHPGDNMKGAKNGLEFCQSTYSGLYGNFINYDKSSNCKSKEDEVLSFIGDHNSYDHLNYLYVSYLSLTPTGFNKNEIIRTNSGDTVLRIILASNKYDKKVAFFNLVKSRGANYLKPFFKFLVDVHNQDILMTHKAFLKLIAEMKPDNSNNPVAKKILNEEIFDTADEAPNLNCFNKTRRKVVNKKGTRKKRV